MNELELAWELPQMLSAAAGALTMLFVILIAQLVHSRLQVRRCLRRELPALAGVVDTQGQTLAALQASVTELIEHLRLDRRHAAEPARSGRVGYDLAIRLAREGATVSEIAGSCAMSAREAQLVWRLHAQTSSPEPSTARGASLQ